MQPLHLVKQDKITVKNKLEAEQLFKISPFKEVIKRTRPHKHDGYFEIIYLSEGAGFHWVDTQKFQINAPVVYFLSGQLHFWEMTSIPKGYVLLFKEEFFDFFKQGSLISLLREMQGTVEMYLSESTHLDFLFSEMAREYKEPSVHSVELIQGYLQVALVKLLRNKVQAELPTFLGSESLYRKFIQQLNHSNPVTNLKVNEVAESLNVTPANLNAVLRKATGRSASELITEQVLLEAKRYLLHTDNTVSEIAFALNFADPSHFVKYFKKSAGETPQAFRNRHVQ